MAFKRQCKNCTFEYEYEGFANLITFCPNCNNSDYIECEYGYGPVVPCRIYYGSKVIGMVSYNDPSEKGYRVDSDLFNLHKKLEHSYLKALEEASDIFSELIKERFKYCCHADKCFSK